MLVTGSTAAMENRMKIAKPAFGLICLAILASNIVTMARWSEARTPPLQAAPLGRGSTSLGVPSR